MTHGISIVGVLPSAHFQMNRGYFSGIVIAWEPPYTVLSTGQHIVLHNTGPFSGDELHINLKDEWWFWNSNVYTPDWIWGDSWYYYQPTGLDYAIPGVTLQAELQHTNEWWLRLQIYAYTGRFEVPLPSNPAYWANPP
jgi:hypothetical protein